ncbi:MAG: hypothetical protein QNK04_20955 [Myxococcota bacterium]|nr:hypothetical protein [Myxococcota bacterium]
MPTGRAWVRLLAGLYTVALVLFVTASLLGVLAEGPLSVLPLELAVDLALVAGCVLFVLGRRVPWWRWVLAGAVVGQGLVLLLVAEPAAPWWPSYALELAAVLGPALVLNLATAGLFARKGGDHDDGFSGSIPKRSQ